MKKKFLNCFGKIMHYITVWFKVLFAIFGYLFYCFTTDGVELLRVGGNRGEVGKTKEKVKKTL